MNWTAENLRHLRYRLGWSQAEMARNLNLDLQTISKWEAGDLCLVEEHRNKLLSILHRAESVADRVHRRPVAEAMMRDRGLSQIHDGEVIECLAEGQLAQADLA